MLKAFRQLRRDLATRTWDNLDDRSPPHFVAHLFQWADGSVGGIHELPPWMARYLPLMRISVGATISIYEQDIEDERAEDFIIGLVPVQSTTSNVTVKHLGVCGEEEWTLSVSPDAPFTPIYRGFTIIPTMTWCKTIISAADSPAPRLLCAMVGHEARGQMLRAFDCFKPLCPEILPDLRYDSRSAFGSAFEKELVESVWHPGRVAGRVASMGLSILDDGNLNAASLTVF